MRDSIERLTVPVSSAGFRVDQRLLRTWPMGAIELMSSCLQDLRIAIRALLKRPAIAIASVLNLAIGLGVVMTVFGWIDNVLLQPVSGAFQPNSLVALESTSSSGEFVTRLFFAVDRYTAVTPLFRRQEIFTPESRQLSTLQNGRRIAVV